MRPTRPFPLITALVATLLAVISPATPGAPDEDTSRSPARLLREALYLERARADLEGALGLYEEVLTRAESPRPLRARALIGRAHCHVLLGRWSEARRGFEDALDLHGDLEEITRFARRHVSQIARYMPADADVFLELVEPGQQVEFLRQLIQGTPLENPVDNYLKPSTRDPASEEIAPRPRQDQLHSLSALLNLEFLNQFKQIEGLGLCLRGLPGEEPEFLAVFRPGSSLLSRGIVTMAMSLSIEEGLGKLEGMSLFRTRSPGKSEEPGFIATTADRDVVFFGRPLELVREAIVRHARPSSTPGLHLEPDFQGAQRHRAGSLIFTYLRPGLPTRLLGESNSTPGDGPTPLAMLGLEGLEELSITLSRSGEDLRLALNGRHPGRIDDRALAADVVAGLPAGAMAASARTSPDLEEELESTLEGLAAMEPDKFDALRRKLAARGLTDPDTGALELGGRLESAHVASVILPPLGEDGQPPGGNLLLSSWLELRARPGAVLDHDRLEDLWTRVLLAVTEAALQTRLQARFEDVTGRDGLPDSPHRIRRLELTPSLAAYSVRDGGRALLFLSRESLELELGRPRDARGDRMRPPVGAHTVVSLRPREILAAAGAGTPDEEWMQALLRPLRATLYGRATGDLTTLGISIPGATPVLKDLLNSLPAGRQER